jgi:hypothetical protein
MIVSEYPNPWFVTRILKNSEKFPGAPPMMSTQARVIRDHSGYVSFKKKSGSRRYDRSLLDAQAAAQEFSSKVIRYGGAVKHLFTDYDLEHVIPSTCALGIWASASTDFENQGQMGLDSDVEYPPEIESAVIEWYKKYMPKEDKTSFSFQRGKGLGFPFNGVSGMNRSLNDTFLSIQAAMVIGNRTVDNSNDQLAGLYDKIRSFHGDGFVSEGFRFQHKQGELLMNLTEGYMSSEQLNPRPRTIIPSSKLDVMQTREPVKKLLGSILKSPNHTQDRAEIAQRISAAQKKGWFVVGTDYGKFDFRHGQKRGAQQIRIHGKVLNDERYINDSMISFDMRAFINGYNQVWELPGSDWLKSGMGNTTLIGCTGNWAGVLASLSYGLRRSARSLLSSYGSNWDCLMWGDDCVFMCSDPAWYDALKKGYKRYKLEVTEEPTIKYLGTNYSKGEFTGTMDNGYAIGRAFQQSFFPERRKEWPFSTIGYIARLDLMGPKGEDWHTAMKPYFEELDYGEWFSFSERHNVLLAMIPEIQKKAEKIGSLDEVLQIFTHGLQGDDFPDDIIPPIYYELLGMETQVDLSDPAKFISDLVQDQPEIYQRLTPDILKSISELMGGNFNSYSRTLSSLTTAFSLQYQAGSVIY